MKKLEIVSTSHSPHIVLDADKKVFIIEGKSFPEDSKQFYQSTLDWIDEYKSDKPENFELHFNLFYLSSSSIISVKQILLKMIEYSKAGTKVKIVWQYDEDDDDIRKTGEDYMKISGLEFSFKVNA